MSIRQEIAEDFADYLKQLGFNDVYGVNVELITPPTTNGKKARSYYNVTFCRTAILDGSVRIFGPNFILVTYTTAIRYLPHRGHFRFDNVDEAKEYFLSTFGAR